MQKVLSILHSPQFKLKLFLWLVFAALATAWYCTTLLAEFIESVATKILGQGPDSTSRLLYVTHCRWWALVPVPWLLYCIMAGIRPVVKTESCLLFAGTAMAASAISLFIGLAGVVELLASWCADGLNR